MFDLPSLFAMVVDDYDKINEGKQKQIILKELK